MQHLWSAQAVRRALGYGVFATLILAFAAPALRLRCHGSAEMHTVLETVAALLALSAAVNALIRYHTRKTGPYLMLGSGLAGAALLDIYHAVVTSPLCGACSFSHFSALTPWSGMMSHLCLSTMLCAGWYVEQREKRSPGVPATSEAKVYSIVGSWTVLSFLVFALAPLPSVYYPDALIHRPAEFISGALFAAALLGYLSQGAWKTDGFEHCRILLLITAVAGHTAYMPYSSKLFDSGHIVAHLLKILGYAFIQVGLFHSMFAAFKREVDGAAGLQRANDALSHEMRERGRAEDALRLAKDDLEVRVAARTAELAERSRLAAMAAEVGAALARADDMQQVLQRCAEIVNRSLDAALVRIWTLDEAGEVLRLQASAGLYTHLDGPHGRIPVGVKKIGMIAAGRRPHVTDSVIGDPQVDQEWAAREGMAAFAGYPLMVEQAIVGVVAVFSRQPLNEHAVRSIESLANEISVGIGRKCAEDLVNVSRERFRMAAENASDVVWQWDPATGQLRSFGSPGRAYDPERFPQSLEALRAALHPDDRERVMASLERHRVAGDALEEEYRTLRPDGEIRYWASRATPLHGVEPGHEVWIGASSDITARMQRASALSQLAAIVESSEAAIMTVNLDGVFEIWNSAAERIFGYSPEEIIGKHFSIILPPERASEQDSILRTIGSGQSIRNRETVRMRKDGERVAVMVTGSPIRDSTGAIVASAAIMNDITQRKLLERQLAQAQKLESIGQLAAGIAHEINTPVQFIGDNIRFLSDGFADLGALLGSYQELMASARAANISSELLASIAEREQTAELDYLRTEIPASIAQSLEGVGRIAAIVKAIREFSHPGSTEKVLVDLNRAVENTVMVSRNEWKYVADLQTFLEPGLPAVSCVPGEVNQVILNLIVNASHAIADKVAQNPGSKGSIGISTRSEAGWVEIRVEDNGTGIPESARANVFDPFFTTKALGKGTGQGLAIAHNVIVQKHHGDIRFETELGVGTCFVIRLPLEGGQGSNLDADPL